jgi:TolB protein
MRIVVLTILVWGWSAFVNQTDRALATFPGRAGRIVFVSGVDRQDIYTIRSDGSQLTRLTRGENSEMDPKWSPDGKSIVYVCGADEFGEQGNICTMSADGSRTKQITRTRESEWQPAWAPDGKRIVFTRTVESAASPLMGANTEVFSMSRDGSNPQQLTDTLDQEAYPSWSPDAQRIVYTTVTSEQSDIWIMDPDGSNASNLTNSGTEEDYPEWDPKGNSILFSRYVRPDSSSPGNWRLFTLNTDGTHEQAIPDERGGQSATWSPDGRRIVFEDIFKRQRLVLFTINEDGTNRSRLRCRIKVAYHSPDWQPLPRAHQDS